MRIGARMWRERPCEEIRRSVPVTPPALTSFSERVCHAFQF
jgi:hypothetical protein